MVMEKKGEHCHARTTYHSMCAMLVKDTLGFATAILLRVLRHEGNTTVIEPKDHDNKGSYSMTKTNTGRRKERERNKKRRRQ